MAKATPQKGFLTSLDPDTKHFIKLAIVGGLAICIFATWLWWHEVYLSPKRVFWAAITNNLATSGVTRHTTQTNDSGSLDQYTHVQLGHEPHIHNLTILIQHNSQDTSRVVSENIATPTTAYARYRSIATTVKG